MSALPESAPLTAMIFMAAALYSSVGHGGASGYLAAMAIMGLAPAAMKPAALSLNILVSSIAFIRFWRAGAFHWGTFWPFAAGSIPLAFAGGAVALSSQVYKQIAGAALVFASFQLMRNSPSAPEKICPPSTPIALGSGGGIGMLSGLTGVGGGIFLSPALILAGWADPRRSAGVSAAFILGNSLSGLMGHLMGGGSFPADLWYWAAAAMAGGVIGSTIGSRYLSYVQLKRALGVVLAVAGIKFILGA